MDEITAELEPQEVAEPVALTHRVSLTVAAKTDMGRVRENNEDKHEFYIAEADEELASRGHILIVCDGMGGHEAGQIASELAVKTFIEVYRSHPAESPEAAAEAAVVAANRFVCDNARAIPSRKGMGTTLSAMLIVQNRVIVAHVGDSRIYRLRDGELTMLTVDHTWVEDTVRMGMMSREEAEKHPYRHMLTRAVGTEDTVPIMVETFDLEEGDRYLLCSDGVTNHVTDEMIHNTLAENTSSGAAWSVVNQALVGGGSDNATVIVARIDKIELVD